jgi:nicotinamide-nucleotide amidase
MKVAFIAVGKEILTGKTINTNLQHVALKLQEIGIEINRNFVIDDQVIEYHKILDIIDEEMIVFSGGLGPTIDDITRETVLSYYGVESYIDQDILQTIELYFERMNIKMRDTNNKQALMPIKGHVLQNELGTAPGVYFKVDGKRVVLLPGPPHELIPMLEELVAILKEELHISYFSKGYRLVGTGESYMESKLKGFYEQHTLVTIAPYAGIGEIKYVFSSSDEGALDDCMNAFKKQFNPYIYGELKESLESVVVEKLKELEYTVSFAESCTGGMIASTIVNVSGSSAVFHESFVTYSNESKKRLLHVSETVLEEFGAVSAECAFEMVQGLYKETHSNICLSVTGIAGPTGGTALKPVGLVYFGVSHNGTITTHRKVFNGNREMIRMRARTYGLNLIREVLDE